MVKPRVLVLRAPGTNCDVETAFAFEQAGGTAESVHVNRLRESPTLLQQFQILCVPGGFSFGDDIAAGRILANQLQYSLGEALAEFRASDKLILGICNGFQVLLKLGVLLPATRQGPPATLAWNDSGHFEDRWVNTRVHGNQCVFLNGVQQLFLPIGHAEGKFVARDADVLGQLDQAGQLALKYCCADGSAPAGFPDNPNGSMADVAGVCDTTGRVFGLMPHPERHLHPTNHPCWTRRRQLPAQGEGCVIFRNAIAFFQ